MYGLSRRIAMNKEMIINYVKTHANKVKEFIKPYGAQHIMTIK